MTPDFTTLGIAGLGAVIWLIRLEAEVNSIKKYIDKEPRIFEARIEKVERELAEVRANLSQISVDVSYIRGILTDKKSN